MIVKKWIHDYAKQTTVKPGEQSNPETPINSPAKEAIRMETFETVSNNTLLAAINKIGETTVISREFNVC